MTFLKPFYTLTDLLSGEKEVTISSVLPLISYIKELCQSDNGVGDESVDGQREIVNQLKIYITDYILTR